MTSIGEYAFDSCSGLTSVTIGNGVTSVGARAFAYCSGLQKVIVKDLAAWCKIDFKDKGANPLDCAHHLYSDENTEIKNLVIPNSVTTIDNFAFIGCLGLTSVTIDNSVTSICNSVFKGCSSLTSVTIGNNVKSIGEYTFSDCSSLQDVYCYAETVPSTDYYYAFYNISFYKIALHVPAASVDAYKAEYPWSEFKTIVVLE